MVHHDLATHVRRPKAWLSVALACCLAMTLGACGGGAKKKDSGMPPLPTEITSLPGTTTSPGAPGGDAGDGAKFCAMFPKGDISTLVGAKVGNGETSGPLGSACSWSYEESSGYVMIQQLSSDYWNPPIGCPDWPKCPEGRAVPGIGDQAYVGPGLLGGWDAGVLLGDTMIIAGVNDGSESNDTSEQAIALLKETVKRLG